jgi:hypothetical protein
MRVLLLLSRLKLLITYIIKALNYWLGTVIGVFVLNNLNLPILLVEEYKELITRLWFGLPLLYLITLRLIELLKVLYHLL